MTPGAGTVEDRELTLARRAAEVGREVAEPAAADVDASSRFPHEAIAALAEQGLLAALAPVEHGGAGASLADVAAAVTAVGRHCASTAMVYAMHCIQVACLARHGKTPAIDAFLRSVVAERLLLASATSEVGIGGDVRSSSCAVEVDGGQFTLVKKAPVISYGESSDAILATARRGPDSPPSDQVLAVCRRAGLTLEATSTWDALGFRGTCSSGFVLTAREDADMICADPFGQISTETMLPVSHVLWGAVWLGIAERATETARRFVQSAARSNPGQTPPGALRLAEVTTLLTGFQALVADAARRYDAQCDNPDALSSIGFTVSMNTLKVAASTVVVDIVTRALGVTGMAGYANRSPYSLGRWLRDAHGAALMVNNDRVLGNSAQLLLAHRES